MPARDAGAGPNMVTSTQSKHGGARVRFPPPLVFLCLLGIGLALERWIWPLPLALAYWPRVLIGASAALGGLLMVLVANIWFRRTGQDPVPWRPSPELIVKGIYRFTRGEFADRARAKASPSD